MKYRLHLRSLIALMLAVITASLPIFTEFATRTRAARRTVSFQTSPTASIAGNNRFLLQIGIDAYDSKVMGLDSLDGCKNDLKILRQVLVEKYGFTDDPAHVRVLVDKQATHAAIVTAFQEHLIASAKKVFETTGKRDAVVVFQYTGHGAQLPYENKFHPDGKTQSIIPIDSRKMIDLKTQSENDILDEELIVLFEELRKYTDNITFIFDSCHSGQITRGSGEKAREYRLPSGVSLIPKPGPVRETLMAQARKYAGSSPNSQLLPAYKSVVTITACGPQELAYEKTTAVTDPKNKKKFDVHNGKMTYHLVEALKTGSYATYRELGHFLKNKVTGQSPHVEGDIDRGLFGGVDTKEPGIAVTSVEGQYITIEAGKVQGIQKDTLLAIYSADAEKLSGNEGLLAQATVIEAQPTTARAKIMDRLQPDKSLNKARAKPISPLFNLAKVRVVNLLGDSTEKSRSRQPNIAREFVTGLKKHPLAELVPVPAKSRGTEVSGQENWDLAVKTGKFGDVFPEANGKRDKWLKKPKPNENRVLPNDDELVCYLQSPFSEQPLFGFYVRPETADADKQITEAIQAFAWQRNLRLLSNDAAPGELKGKVELRLLKVTSYDLDKNQEATNIKNDEFTDQKLGPPLNLSLNVGDAFQIALKNTSDRDLYVTVFNISSDGGVTIFYPRTKEASRSILLPQGKEVIARNPLKFTPPVGEEIFKVIATTDPTDFSFVERPPVRTRTGSQSQIETLIGFSSNKVSRAVEDIPTAGPVTEWIVNEVTVTLK